MADGERLTLTLSSGGDVVIKLRPDLAPGHVQRITELADSGFYDNVAFHRVIPGFMAQGGDPAGPGASGTSAAPPRWRASRTRTARTASSSSASTMPGSSTDNIPSGVRSRAEWN